MMMMMAKGRKLTTSRSQMLLGSYGSGHGYGYGPSAGDASEIREDDVWSMADEVAADGGSRDVLLVGNFGCGSAERSDCRGGRAGDVGVLSLALENSSGLSRGSVPQYLGGGNGMAASAPVNIPDWSKIYRVDSRKSIHNLDEEAWAEEGRELDMVPPHEYLAREYVRSRRSAADSVFEGVGRTLKGRDMRRVRDAVWSQTGFYG
ncbi:hypothetical protein MLD38_021071 [Melastoma candidum]|uniref:Uncharacterized protein n=1 Tax=Melastoma candidum TaxID=119954 RepID=A0ACB9QEZ8_9MYRT|nr:hypothetical protein MLD38_021071 [Melastoma candidum]